MLDVKPGDMVAIVDVNRKEARKGYVDRVGPKNVYLRGDRTRYDRATGRAKDAYGHVTIVAMAEYTTRERERKAREELRAFGVEVSRTFTPGRVFAIREALDFMIKGT